LCAHALTAHVLLLTLEGCRTTAAKPFIQDSLRSYTTLSHQWVHGHTSPTLQALMTASLCHAIITKLWKATCTELMSCQYRFIAVRSFLHHLCINQSFCSHTSLCRALHFCTYQMHSCIHAARPERWRASSTYTAILISKRLEPYKGSRISTFTCKCLSINCIYACAGVSYRSSQCSLHTRALANLPYVCPAV